MSRKKTTYICIGCGADFPKWLGRCPTCDEWNTIVEADVKKVKEKKHQGKAVPLSSIVYNKEDRIDAGISEFNLVCGGGIVAGSVVLIGGDPGIGKSTLAMQIAANFETLYVSGEESSIQLRHRAERLGNPIDSIKISTSTIVEDIVALAHSEKPQCLVIDSIQTLYSDEFPGMRGSVSQIRESASKLVDFAKKTGIPVILIGHITKDGSIAGPKLLEHIVDTVLYFEGNFSKDLRMLKAFKNRFGSVNEIGLFRMTENGLIEIKDKNKIFFSPFVSTSPGNAVSAALEGSRTMLFEVQALATFSSYPNPRRMADGLDLNRLIIITAVLERHAELKLNTFDIFINVSGGFQIQETSADLAVAVSIASSLKNKPVPEGIGFLGEISLSGEIRPVPQCSRRMQEFVVAGFNTIVIPKSDADNVKISGSDCSIVGVSDIREVIEKVL